MNKIIINGKVIEVQNGKNISVVNDQVYVDGQLVDSGLSGIVKIQFEGDLASLKTSGNVDVHGSVEGNLTAGGNVESGDVTGNISAGGNISCGCVTGNASAGGNIKMER